MVPSEEAQSVEISLFYRKCTLWYLKGHIETKRLQDKGAYGVGNNLKRDHQENQGGGGGEGGGRGGGGGGGGEQTPIRRGAERRDFSRSNGEIFSGT